MRTIGVVTVARSDYGIYLPILRQIQADTDLRLHLIVAGMHLSPEFGLTVRDIEADGFTVDERIEMLLSSDSAEGVAKSIGLGIIGFAQAYSRTLPDILLILGDRFEMLAAAAAALPFTIPLAHLHGGETTEGAIDESIRHAITKMAHLHFVATAAYGQRVMQMGEEAWRVTVSGAPSLDNLRLLNLLTPPEVEKLIGMSLQPPPLLVTYHPVTLEQGNTQWHITELLSALEEVNLPLVFTYPNADVEGRMIIRAFDHFTQTHPNAVAVANLGTQAYFSLMKYAVAIVGNSSSGIIEAASLGAPVVNIGNRQRGRMHGKNVVNVGYERQTIIRGIQEAMTPTFRVGLIGLENPYGDGHAAESIIQVLRTVSLDERLLQKRFQSISLIQN